MFHIVIHMFTITAYEPIPVFNIKIVIPTLYCKLSNYTMNYLQPAYESLLASL